MRGVLCSMLRSSGRGLPECPQRHVCRREDYLRLCWKHTANREDALVSTGGAALPSTWVQRRWWILNRAEWAANFWKALACRLLKARLYLVTSRGCRIAE